MSNCKSFHHSLYLVNWLDHPADGHNTSRIFQSKSRCQELDQVTKMLMFMQQMLT
jgi:hypothetical protein